VPRYVLPCATASDCGSGFQCESTGQECSCSGSNGSAGGSDPADGGTPAPVPAPAEPDCVCEPSKELRCQAASVSCEKNGDCPADWSCAVVASRGDCTSPATPTPNPGDPARDGGAAGDGTPPPDCAPSVEVKQCVPPYYALIQGAYGGAREDDASGPTLGGGDLASGPGNPALPPSAESGDGDATSSAGCSVAPGSRTSSTLAVLGVLGLFGALRRRRAR